LLVIGRRPGQYIVIDDRIKVVVKKSPRGALRLGIDAPRNVKVVRGELIQDHNSLVK